MSRELLKSRTVWWNSQASGKRHTGTMHSISCHNYIFRQFIRSCRPNGLFTNRLFWKYSTIRILAKIRSLESTSRFKKIKVKMTSMWRTWRLHHCHRIGQHNHKPTKVLSTRLVSQIASRKVGGIASSRVLRIRSQVKRLRNRAIRTRASLAHLKSHQKINLRASL